jgi:DNA-directed RNA polymerase subunit M/transcription elongation factor TFIIS
MKNLKTYQLYCNNCSYKRFSNGSDVEDLFQVKQSSIPRGSPSVDPQTKKVVVPKSIKRIKLFKCPKCGFTMKSVELKLSENQNEQANRFNGSETGFTGQEIS